MITPPSVTDANERRRLKQYGPLSEETAAYLTKTSSRLERAVFELLNEPSSAPTA